MIKVILLAYHLLNAMNSWTPPAQHAYLEKEAVTNERYANLALAIAEVSLDPNQTPMFEGEDGRIKTALVLASIASYESGGFTAAAMDCKKLGDSGAAKGPFQTHSSYKETCGNYNKAAIIALQMANASIRTCKKYSLTNRLSQYTTGHCQVNLESRQRMGRGLDYYKKHPMDILEIEVINSNKLVAIGTFTNN